MPTAVVTGANSGIGYAFAQILIKEGYSVYAADLNIGPNILALGSHADVKALDVGLPESIAAFKQRFGTQPLDLLLNIAGTMVSPDSDGLTTSDLPIFTKTFSTNTFGPFLLTQALLPNLLCSNQPRIGNMSSRVGSIADNGTGGSYAYRSSKAALNSISKSMAVDLKKDGVIVVIMHPGIVKTGMVPERYWVAEAVGPDEAAGKLWTVLMSKGIEESGKFWHKDGYELQW